MVSKNEKIYTICRHTGRVPWLMESLHFAGTSVNLVEFCDHEIPKKKKFNKFQFACAVQFHSPSVVSDQSAVSSSCASCPARQRGLVPSQREGEFTAPCGPGSPHPHASNLRPSHNPLQRECQQCETCSRVSFTSTKIPQTSPLLTPRWHPRLNHTLLSHICVQCTLRNRQLNIAS